MLLHINEIYVNYGKVKILEGVTMEIEKGKIMVLLGANGSGKSTLLKTISGLNHPISGSIWYRGERIDRMASHKISRLGIAFLPEGRRIFADMTVSENLEMGSYSRKNKNEINKDRETIYNRFPILKNKRNMKSGNLSGGEQQTLAIARALMTKANLFLMDEPSQGLAPLLVNEVAETTKNINADGITIILVEHNLRLGLSISDNVFVLKNGRIEFSAKSNDLTGVDYAKRIYLGR